MGNAAMGGESVCRARKPRAKGSIRLDVMRAACNRKIVNRSHVEGQVDWSDIPRGSGMHSNGYVNNTGVRVHSASEQNPNGIGVALSGSGGVIDQNNAKPDAMNLVQENVDVVIMDMGLDDGRFEDPVDEHDIIHEPEQDEHDIIHEPEQVGDEVPVERDIVEKYDWNFFKRS
ncbi:hypothetical protein PHJA_001586800 [Phtheirospermum japonicum]|uniref:Uncharacterized protein n=1 Tax=Phtheirospermum japonicum TaxID=374723 RepID=A0A830CDM5_9LAMI|nr:hypothetical protein PHJA_001586800 [Phtheirospermum japonicum]